MTSTRNELLDAAEAVFADIAACTPAYLLLSHFSTTHVVNLSHAPPNTYTYPVTGLDAIRSYFDLLHLHWSCQDMQTHEARAYEEKQRVVFCASVRWKWRISGRSWTEVFTCTLDYDEHRKIKNFFVRTESDAKTCLMLAVDRDRPLASVRAVKQAHY